MTKGNGVYSEVGKLRKVLVCEPGLGHERLTPSNRHDLLFDDVLWVEQARKDHAEFVGRMTDRGIEVIELHELLRQTMEIPEARSWLLDRKVTSNEVGIGLIQETRAYLDALSSAELTRLLIGGLSTRDLPKELRPGYGAGTLLYVLARRENRLPTFRIFEAVLCALLVIAGIAGVVGLVTGLVTI